MTTKLPDHIHVNTMDMTLAELDRAGKLERDGRAGRLVATAYVWLKREHPSVELADVAKLTFRDITISDESDDDTGDEVGPTPEP